ncbi:MAG: glutamate-1-semialdehyde 2,1-aminomutase [bacterium]|nr:glutamate-1-semialdehyde 2,1-aminomutase [bacterium]
MEEIEAYLKEQENRKQSERLFNLAKKYIPGGVNSPVRAFGAVGGNPIFIKGGSGSRVIDMDDREYIDYVCSWGPLILGHAHPEVISAVTEAAKRGTTFGAPTEREIELARLITEAFPSIDLVRMVNSGTEAVMSAIRLARAYTQRNRIIKFEGCYHGHSDSLLVKAGSGAATLGLPDSPGIPPSLTQYTYNLPYNNLAAAKEVIEIHHADIAAVIVEPVAGNMGVIPPMAGFLEGLRELTEKHGILLIFDEIITGFRVTYGGVQTLFDINPDLTCLGKIIGGGFPVGAYGGRGEIMEMIAPSGPVYQAGTLSGNPVAMAAGIATLKILSDKEIYQRLEKTTGLLTRGLSENIKQLSIPAVINQIGSMFSLFFTDGEVRDYASAKTADTKRYARYFRQMLKQGIYLPPSQFETVFVSTAHSETDIERTVQAGFTSLKE